MKRLIAAALIFIIICGISLTSTIYLYNTKEELVFYLDQAAESVEKGDYTEAMQLTQQAESAWNKAEPRLSLFIDHKDLDTIATSISKILPYLRNDQHIDFLAECETLTVLLKHLYRAGSFSMEIF